MIDVEKLAELRKCIESLIFTIKTEDQVVEVSTFNGNVVGKFVCPDQSGGARALLKSFDALPRVLSLAEVGLKSCAHYDACVDSMQNHASVLAEWKEAETSMALAEEVVRHRKEFPK